MFFGSENASLLITAEVQSTVHSALKTQKLIK